jgi:hypothetical protein
MFNPMTGVGAKLVEAWRYEVTTWNGWGLAAARDRQGLVFIPCHACRHLGG